MNDLFDKALKEQYAIGQFNISTDVQLRAIIETAIELKSPVIIGASENERKFMGDTQLVALVKSWEDIYQYPIILNADHSKTFDSAKSAVDAGFNAIHFDGSALDFDENVSITTKVVEYSRNINKDIVVEGELGYLRGGSNIHKEKTIILDEDLTKPIEAQEFYQKTNIDNLAIVIGNIHGIEAKMKNPNLHIDRLKEINSLMPDAKLVLHGGSGTPIADIKEAIKYGIVKININTELRIAYSNALRKYLSDNPDIVKPYNILAPTIKDTKKIIKNKIELFGSKNKI